MLATLALLADHAENVWYCLSACLPAYLPVCLSFCLLQPRSCPRLYTPGFPTTHHTWKVRKKKKASGQFCCCTHKHYLALAQLNSASPRFPLVRQLLVSVYEFYKNTEMNECKALRKIITENKRPFRQNELLARTRQQCGHKLTRQTHYYSCAGPTPSQ